MYVEVALSEAIALVNGITMLQEQDTRFINCHHIELTQYNILLAEGMSTESFLNTGRREMFEINGTYVYT